MSTIIFDQNILHRILSKDEKNRRFSECFIESLRQNGFMSATQSSISLHIGNYSLYELIRIPRTAMQKLDNVREEILKRLEEIMKEAVDYPEGGSENEIKKVDYSLLIKAMKVKTAVFEIYKNECRRAVDFSRENLIKLMDKEIENSWGEGRKLLEEIKDYAFKGNEGIESLIHTTALDRVFAFDAYPKEVLPQLVVSFQHDIYKNICEGSQTITSRSSQYFLRRAINDSTAKSQKKKILIGIRDRTSFGARKDIVDAAIVHYSVIGKRDSNNYLAPVSCITCDDENKIIERISLFKSIVEDVIREFEHSEKTRLSSYPSFGKVLFFSKEGYFKRSVNVCECHL